MGFFLEKATFNSNGAVGNKVFGGKMGKILIILAFVVILVAVLLLAKHAVDRTMRQREIRSSPAAVMVFSGDYAPWQKGG